MSRRPALSLAWAAQFGLFLLLTLLAWGLFAPDRGFIQDEPWLLGALRAQRAALFGFLWPGYQSLELTPLRPFGGVPFALAVHTPWPRLVLQLCFGLTWLWSGLLAARFARLTLPGSAAHALAAGALVLTACGDHTMNSLAYLTSWQAAAVLLAALVEAVAWVLCGRRRSGVWAFVLLPLALLTYDGVLAGALAAPVVLLALPLADDARAAGQRARRTRALLVWLALAGSHALAFVWFMSRPGNYGARMIGRPDASELARRALKLFALNFTPWEWVSIFVRPEDGSGPQALTPGWRMGLALGACLACVAVGLLTLRGGRQRHAAARPPARTGLKTALALLLATFAANAGVALVVGWPFRSQIVSRLFASLAIARCLAALARTAERRGLARAAALAFLGVLPFVFGGVQAGLASQDMYLTLWRRHRLELRSLMDQVPALSSGGQLLLYLPPGSPFTSMWYGGVGVPWLDYLYAPAPASLIWGQVPFGQRCQAQVDAFECRRNDKDDCYTSGACQPSVLPFERLVLLAYVRASGRFELQERLPPDLAPQGDAGYAPRALVVPRARSRWARELLDGPEWAARFFPGPAPPG